MTTMAEDNTAETFLSAIWGADSEGNLTGVHFIAESTDMGWRHHQVKAVTQALNKAQEISNAGRNAYFACASFNKIIYNVTNNGFKYPAGRTQDNAKQARSFWLDLDCDEEKAAKGKGYLTKPEALTALVKFCKLTGLPSPTALVDSGNGMHVYWLLDMDVSREDWCASGALLKALTEKHGLLADQSRTSDIASVLRVPGTRNMKDLPNPKPVTIKKMMGPIPFTQFKAALEAAIGEARPNNTALTGGLVKNHIPMPETPENVERIKSMLKAIPADCGRDDWRNICWAVQSLGWAGGVELAREWSMTAADQYGPAEFDKLTRSYNPTGGIGFGTLVHHAKHHGWEETNTIESEHFTGNGGDVANGRLFAQAHRHKLLFVHETGDVLRFDAESGWVNAPHGEEDRAAKTVLTKLRDMAVERYKAAPDDPKTKRLMAHVERTSKAPNLRAMIEMAKSEHGMTVSIGEFDNDPMRLGVANGVLDLENGKLLPITPDLLISKRCAVEFHASAECPMFMRFLAQVHPDKDMQEFMQRWFGYCLTGSVQEQKFLFLYGGGANGKSVFVELVAWLLGDYSRKIATEMLMHHMRSPQGPSPDIVALKGRRFVYANETEEGRRLAEARIKDMTGGDTLTGRVPYGKADITFTPTHKLVIVGNHRPEITDNSFGMWRRVALVPFEVTIPEADRDPRLLDKLKDEGSGILNWGLEGLRKQQQSGLSIPQKILDATATYRDEQDVVGDWIGDHCDTGTGLTEKKHALYRAYRFWALANGHHPLAQGRLTRRLSDRGYRLQKDKRTIAGLALNPRGRVCA